MSEPQEQERITPPPALGPPIIGPDTAGSAPGIAQPVMSTGPSLPPSLPAGTTFTSPGWGWLPPPQVGMGENEPFPTGVIVPAAVPPSLAGVPQPQFATGSGTSPTAASLFPSFTAAGPNPPIVVNATQAAGTGTTFPDGWIKPPPVTYTIGQGIPPSGLPTTPGTSPTPVALDGWGLYAGPNPPTLWPSALIEEASASEPEPPPVEEQRTERTERSPPPPPPRDPPPTRRKRK